MKSSTGRVTGSQFVLLSCISLLFLSGFDFSREKGNGKVGDTESIRVEGGLISGILLPNGDVRAYKGIPFAAPPVAERRWKAPQPVIPWKDVRSCVVFGPSPMQAPPVPFSMWSEEFLIPEKPISEDCLYLNVWTGARSVREKRPVLVWIYGGGFQSGGSAVPVYDGEALARKGIILVSINYRVGIFGFFAHPELTRESGHHASGNYGLLDQIAALQWVKRNIAAFGGDPDNITIAGQSAGSMSVNCLVASPLAKNLFRKAIAQSGAAILRGVFGHANLEAAEQDGVKTARSLHTSSLSELRRLDPAELMKAQQSVRGPIIDGYVLPDAIGRIFLEAKENRIGLLTGWNQDEGLLFGPLKNAETFKEDIERDLGTDAAEFLSHYPATNDPVARKSQIDMARDRTFGVQNYAWANIQAGHGSNVYVYRFTRKVPGTGAYADNGAFHTGEVPYAFNNIAYIVRSWRPWGETDHRLAEIMSSCWVNFVKSGDPNGPGLPIWPRYGKENRQIMDLGDTPVARTLPDTERLDVLQRLMTAGK